MTTPRVALPQHGIAWETLKAELEDAATHDMDWRHGRLPAYIHYAGEDVLDVSKQAFMMYFSENGLGLQAFRSLATMEAEVVGMGLGLLHGDDAARGAMTTGGTESIFLAVKAARDYAAARRSITGKPRIVLAESAHPAFDKAAYFMGVETVRTPITAAFTADPEVMAEQINADTIMIVGSVPAYPHGVVDPLPALSDIALERGVWLHVDACVGGYLAPFAEKLGRPIPAWDFRLPGVSSISADLHKYGYTAKGASTLFFSSEEKFRHMGYSFDAWPRGQYFTHTLVGTRPGGAIAAAWAVMKFLGEDGYLDRTRRLLALRQGIEDGVAKLGMHTLGRPELAIVAYGSHQHDIATVGAGLKARGWGIGFTRNPPGIQTMLNMTHEPVLKQYLQDVADSADAAPAAGSTKDLHAVY